MSYADYMRSPDRDALAARGYEPCELCGGGGKYRAGDCPRCHGVGEHGITKQSRLEYEKVVREGP